MIQLKKKEDDQFVILKPQLIPHPSDDLGDGLSDVTGEVPKRSSVVVERRRQRPSPPAADLIYDSNNHSYRSPDNRHQIIEEVIRSQLRKG